MPHIYKFSTCHRLVKPSCATAGVGAKKSSRAAALPSRPGGTCCIYTSEGVNNVDVKIVIQHKFKLFVTLPTQYVACCPRHLIEYK